MESDHEAQEADEFSPGLHGELTVDKATAKAGDILTYRLRLAISTAPYQLGSVRFTDELPGQLACIPGSLSAPSGEWSEAGGILHNLYARTLIDPRRVHLPVVSPLR